MPGAGDCARGHRETAASSSIRSAKATFSSSCDIAKTALARAGVPYTNAPAPVGAVAIVRIGETAVVESFEGRALVASDPAAFKQRAAAFNSALKSALTTAGYPAKADAAQANTAALVGLCWLLVLLVTMVYGPIAAWLVELFPPRIRYTSMSLPYHIGNGWFGGFLPVTAFAIVAATGNIYAGLWYPVIVALCHCRDRRPVPARDPRHGLNILR